MFHLGKKYIKINTYQFKTKQIKLNFTKPRICFVTLHVEPRSYNPTSTVINEALCVKQRLSSPLYLTSVIVCD